MDRLKKRFFLFHLCSSLVIISVTSLICQQYWFPDPFLLIDGTWFAISLLAIIDIIVGPLLTLLLVNSKKSNSELKVDLIIILFFQISAFVYGLTKIYEERIYSLVYANSIFHPIPVKEIDKKFQISKLNLPQYKGIYYAMVKPKGSGKSNLEKHAIYSPDKYQALTNEILKGKEVEYDSLPKNITSQYNTSFIFKVLAGKKRSAIIVLDKQMNILNIELGAPLSN
jgi:hypothetical protein